MIKYNLECSCGETFESWFQNSSEYEKLLKKNLINCYVCGSSKTVKKSIMAPSIATSKTSTTSKDSEQKKEFLKNVKSKIRELNDYVAKNAEYVGDKFVSEVRSIHYDKKQKRNIYGNATLEETKELQEEGIDVATIPWVPKENA
ncbi:MAG: hypothetical protein RL652_319 [Pseudomonadota bacterium]|jgi:hypothetical protein